MRQEYLPSAVKVLANSVNIEDQNKSDFFQPNLPGIIGKKG